MSVTRKIKIKIAEPDVFEEKELGVKAKNIKFNDGSSGEDVNTEIKNANIEIENLKKEKGNFSTLESPDFFLPYPSNNQLVLINYSLTIDGVRYLNGVFFQLNDNFSNEYIIKESYYKDEDYKIDFIITLKLGIVGITSLSQYTVSAIDIWLTSKKYGYIVKSGETITILEKNPDHETDPDAPEMIEHEITPTWNIPYNFEINNIALLN